MLHVLSSIRFVGLSLVLCLGGHGISTARAEHENRRKAEVYLTVHDIPVYGPESDSSIGFFNWTLRNTENCRVSQDKVDHVASVLAEYLDSDLDGEVDNKDVLKKMKKQRACIVVGCMDEPLRIDGVQCQEVFDEEIRPGSRGDRFDATLEEVLHLVSQNGYAIAYPKVYGENRRSKIGKAMKKARGGVVGGGRDSYPPNAWYTYDDRTCDGRCMVTEYFYWGLTSLLGGQDYPGRLEQIRQEWPLNTKAKVKKGDRELYKLLWRDRKKYKLPSRLPDGYFVERAAEDGKSIYEKWPKIFRRR